MQTLEEGKAIFEIEVVKQQREGWHI